ncbi:hypothetical protein D3C80_1599910 [compost metagenome]
MRLVSLAGFLLAQNFSCCSIGAAALIQAGLLGSLFGAAGGGLALLLDALLCSNAVGLGLDTGALGLFGLQFELQALVLGFPLLCGGLISQVLFALGGCVTLGLLLLGHTLAFLLDSSFLCQPDAVLFGALFSFAAQALQLCLLSLSLLMLLE